MTRFTPDDLERKGFVKQSNGTYAPVHENRTEEKPEHPLQHLAGKKQPELQPEFNKWQGKEDDFQIKVAQYLDGKNILWTHAANERKTQVKFNKKGQAYTPSGNKLKAKGQKKGFPDIMIFDPSPDGKYVGFSCELKAGYNKPSPEQLEWLKQLKKRNWKTLITYSYDEFIFEVESYFQL